MIQKIIIVLKRRQRRVLPEMVRVSINTGKLLVVCPSATRGNVNRCSGAAAVSGWQWQSALLRRMQRCLTARYNLRDIRCITLTMGEAPNLVKTAHQPEAQRKKERIPQTPNGDQLVAARTCVWRRWKRGLERARLRSRCERLLAAKRIKETKHAVPLKMSSSVC